MRKLSECKPNENTYAFCSNCVEFFIDDVLLSSSLNCPNSCGWALERGIILHRGVFCRVGKNTKREPVIING